MPRPYNIMNHIIIYIKKKYISNDGDNIHSVLLLIDLIVRDINLVNPSKSRFTGFFSNTLLIRRCCPQLTDRRSIQPRCGLETVRSRP